MTNCLSTLTKHKKHEKTIKNSWKQRQNEIIKMLDKKTIKETESKKHTHIWMLKRVFLLFVRLKTEVKSTQNMHNNILF